MALYSDRASRRGGATERRIRNAHTGAGVNANRLTASGDGSRARDTRRARDRHDRVGDRYVPTYGVPPRGPRADRLTVAEELLRSRVAHDRVGATQPLPQQGRGGRPQERIHNTDDDGGGNQGVPRGRPINNTAPRLSAPMAIRSNGMTQSTTNPATNNVNSSISNQESALFCGSQPTQIPNIPQMPITPRPPTHPPVRPATTITPIRMLNRPIEPKQPIDPKLPKPTRPVNTYRGKDPIKKLVTNPKLRAILAGRAPPKQRKKPDRPDLRMGASRITR